jgi:hypothetical protein
MSEINQVGEAKIVADATERKRTRAGHSAMPYVNGKTTVVPAGPAQAVRLARCARPVRGVARSNKVLM